MATRKSKRKLKISCLIVGTIICISVIIALPLIHQAQKSHYNAGLNLINSDISAACEHFHKAGNYDDASLNYELLDLCIKSQNWDDGKIHSLKKIRDLTNYNSCAAYQVFSDTKLGKQLVQLQGEWVTTETWHEGERLDSSIPPEYRIVGGNWRRIKGISEGSGSLSYLDGTIYLNYSGPTNYTSITISEDDTVTEIQKSVVEVDESEVTLLFKSKWSLFKD